MTGSGGIFISYASVDRGRVQPIVDDLEARDIPCWFDERALRPFDSELTERISAGIANTTLTMAFVSSAYQASEACRWELLRTVQTSGLRDLLLVRLEGFQSAWSILQENVFCDLSQPDSTSIGELVARLSPPIPDRPSRGLPVFDRSWWPNEWTSNAFDGRFDQRLRLISMFTPHIADPKEQGRRNRQAQIVGLGGQGKSMLALQVASDLSCRYPGGVVRLNAGGDQEDGVVSGPASTMDHLLGQIHDWASWAAQRIGIEVLLPDRSDKNAWTRMADAVRPLVQGTLWLIDDLPAGLDAQDMNRILCPSPGDTLITTRTNTYKRILPHTTLTLDAFSCEESLYLLAGGSAATIQRDGEVLTEIAETVGHHALALAVLAARLEAWPAQGVLNDLRNAPIDQLEDCARDVPGLPTQHGPSVVATLRMSVGALRRQQALDVLRVAAIWPAGKPLPIGLLMHTIASGPAGGTAELVDANLAQLEGTSALRVHAIVASVAAWLIQNEPECTLGDSTREKMLRSRAVEWLAPLVTEKDLWDASDAGRTAWHLLEPVEADWTDTERTTAYLSLMAMARLPMRHKPGGLTGTALTEHLEVAVTRAQQASSLFTGDSRPEALFRGRALAMEGLLRMSLAGRAADSNTRERHASQGRRLLDESILVREPWLVDSEDPDDQDELERAYFNHGRLVSLAKVLAVAGDHPGALETLDQAEAAYVRIGQLRRERLDTDIDDEAPEKLASCYRGEAIVALTRVTHQVGPDRQTRMGWLAHATDRLCRAMEQTSQPARGQDEATPDMCKDVAMAIKTDVVRRMLQHAGDGDVRMLVESLMCEVDDTPVPWPPSTQNEMVDAATGFARLRIASDQGGKGTTAMKVADELITEDCPALLRTLELSG